MPRLYVQICLILVCLGSIAVNRLDAQTVHDAGMWNVFVAQGNFEKIGWQSDKLRWWFDGQLRFLEDADGFNQSLVRPGLGWAISERSTLWAGYVWVRTSPFGGPDFDEHRPWQQWTWSKPGEVVNFGARTRFEQRLLDTGSDTGLRFRQLFRLQHNLPDHPHLALVGWNEVFYHLNDTDWGAESGFDQNRAFVGLSYKTDPDSRWRTEIGYLSQVIEIPSGPDRSNHLLSLSVFRSP